MRMDKLTSKFQLALQDAQSSAVGRDHQFIEPAHLMLAFLDPLREEVIRQVQQLLVRCLPGLACTGSHLRQIHRCSCTRIPRQLLLNLYMLHPGRTGHRRRMDLQVVDTMLGREYSLRRKAPTQSGIRRRIDLDLHFSLRRNHQGKHMVQHRMVRSAVRAPT